MSKNYDGYYIKLVLGGKTSEFSFLIDKYKEMVFTIALKISGNREDAEEIAQDVFVKAYQGLAGFRASSKFSTWLYSIAYNHSISFIRRKYLETIPLQTDTNPVQEAYGEDDPQFSQLDDIPAIYAQKALECLDKTDQIILTLFYKEECPVKEIAKITGLSIANIKVKLFRGRKKVLDELKKIFKTELVDLL
jgi:RNA polymerase sigma-70 factor (ECF subfamily)